MITAGDVNAAVRAGRGQSRMNARVIREEEEDMGKIKVFFKAGYSATDTAASYTLTNAAAVLDMLEDIGAEPEHVADYDVFFDDVQPYGTLRRQAEPAVMMAEIDGVPANIARVSRVHEMTVSNTQVVTMADVGISFATSGETAMFTVGGDTTTGFTQASKTREQLDALIGEDGTLVIEQTLGE